MNRLSILVVGGDSKVGTALASSLRHGGYRVWTTSRRPGASADIVPLDLADCAGWQPPDGVDVAVLAAAMTNHEACRQDPRLAEQVNVHGLLEVATALHHRGAFLIFLSSSAVFDGKTLLPRANSPLTPVGEYGRNKAAAETALQQLTPNCAIVRLTKVLEPVVPLFRNWMLDLRQGKPIEPFADVSLAPVPLNAVVHLLRLLIDTRRAGIWQLSGDRDVSYAIAAGLAAQIVNAREEQVRPIRARALGRVPPDFPARTAMNGDRLREEFGLQPPPVEWTLKACMRQTWLSVLTPAARAA